MGLAAAADHGQGGAALRARRAVGSARRGGSPRTRAPRVGRSRPACSPATPGFPFRRTDPRRGVLVGDVAADPDHVHAAVDDQSEGLPERRLGRAQGHHVGGHPERAPAEDGNPVQREGECAARPVDLDRPEPDLPQRPARCRRRPDGRDRAVGRRVCAATTVRRRGPGPSTRRRCSRRLRRTVAVCASLPDTELDLHCRRRPPRGAAGGRRSRRLPRSAPSRGVLPRTGRGAGREAHRPPGPDRRSAGRPARDAAEQRSSGTTVGSGSGAAGCATGGGACAGPATARGRRSGGGARCEDRECVDRQLVGDPHVLRVQEVLAVQPDVGDGGEPIELEAPGTRGRSPRARRTGTGTTSRSHRGDPGRHPPTPPTELSQRARRPSRARSPGAMTLVPGQSPRHVESEPDS